MKKRTIELKIFVPSVILTSATIFVMLFFPDETSLIIDGLFNFLTTDLGWIYLIIVLVLASFSVWLVFSKYGSIKLGDPDDKKEYSDWHWVAMVFTAGMSVSVILLGFAEPISLLSTPPLGIEPLSDASYQAAHMYEQFAEGFIAWAIYGPASVAVAYTIFVKKIPLLRLSSTCSPVLGKKSKGVLGNFIDVLVMLGMIGGISTSLGMGTPAVTALIERIFGIPQSPYLTCGVVLVWSLLFGASVFLGLEKGIKLLSNFNLYILFALAALVVISAPLLDILRMEVSSLGLLIDNIGQLTLGTSPFNQDTFTQDWTIFYWAWWLGFMPMMALFGARISRGRTVRQLILGEILYGGGGSMFVFALFGGYSLHLQHSGKLDLLQITEVAGREGVLIAVLETLPLPEVTLFMVMVLLFVFLATTIDSTAYTLASVCTTELKGDEQPVRWNRMLWAIILLLFALGLIFIGGLQTIQTASIVLGFPIIFISIIIMFSLIKMLRAHDKNKLN